MTRLLAGLALALAVVSFWPASSQAQRRHGYHGRYHGNPHYRHGPARWGPSRWRGGHWYRGDYRGRFGWWWVVGPSWYYYARPVYPYPPQVVVVPPAAPVQAPPQASVAPQPAQPKPYCREYQGDAIINGSNQPYYGTACLQPDGTWRIMN